MYRFRNLALALGGSSVVVIGVNVFFPLPMVLIALAILCLVCTLGYFARLELNVKEDAAVNMEDVQQSFALLERAIDFEIDILSKEVLRACTLIDAGTKDMSQSFYELQEISQDQQNLLMQVSGDNEHGNCAIDACGTMTQEKLDQVTSRAIQTLQFEDIVSQSLQSMSDNVNQLSLISGQLRGMSTSTMPFNQQLVQLESICQTFTTRKVQASQHRTVSQESLDEGDIDLF